MIQALFSRSVDERLNRIFGFLLISFVCLNLDLTHGGARKERDREGEREIEKIYIICRYTPVLIWAGIA